MAALGRARLRYGLALGVGAALLAVIASPALAPVSAKAEVQKVLFVCIKGRQKQICPQVRAPIRAPEGWTEDRAAEAKQGRVIFVPKTKTFETAPTAITVTTTPNKAKTAIDTISQREQATFREEHKEAIIALLAPIQNDKLGGLVKLTRVTAPDVRPRGFMIVTRFADTDSDGALYTIEVTLSASSERGLFEARPKLDAIVKGY